MSEYDRKKKISSSGRSRARKHDKSVSLTPDSSVERSPKVDYRDEGKKHSRNRSKEKQRKREKEAAPRKHHHSSKRKSSPVDSDEDDFREPKISDSRSGKMGGGKDERSRSKKSSPDRRQKRRSSSVERRRGGEYKAESSASKRKRRDSSSERELTEKRSRRDDSREKSTRKRETSRDKYSKPFYGKKTRLTVSDSESDRSSSSPDRRKAKSKPNHKSNRIDAEARFSSGGAAKHKNRFPSRRNSDSEEQSADESKLSRENRRPPFEKVRIESSKTLKNYVSADKSKSVRNDNDKNRVEDAKPSPLAESQPEVASRMTTPSKIIDSRHGKTVIDAQRNGVEAAPAVENGVNVDGSVTNRDSSTSSSLSYSPMEKYPHRYKDILADVSKKGQKSELSVRRSEIKDRTSPVKVDDRSKKENEVKPPDAKEKPQSVMTTKNVAPPVSESKSENFCLSEVPLPPVGGSSSTTKLPTIRDGADVAAESPKKAAKLIDSTSALVKSIPPALSQKPNTLASSISDVIAKSMQKRDTSSSSESLRKRKSRSSSKSSSSSDSSLRYVLFMLLNLT